jgi:hypothetical protein
MNAEFLSTGFDAKNRPCVMRCSADDAAYLVIVLPTPWSRRLATLSPGTVCWQAQSPNAAAMNRTLAKFTDFMAVIQSVRA